MKKRKCSWTHQEKLPCIQMSPRTQQPEGRVKWCTLNNKERRHRNLCTRPSEAYKKRVKLRCLPILQHIYNSSNPKQWQIRFLLDYRECVSLFPQKERGTQALGDITRVNIKILQSEKRERFPTCCNPEKFRNLNPLDAGACASFGADDCGAMSPDDETAPDSMSESGTTVSNSDSVDILSFEENETTVNSWDPHLLSYVFIGTLQMDMNSTITLNSGYKIPVLGLGLDYGCFVT